MKYSTTTYTPSQLNYDSFGMLLVGRSWSVGSEYRYGFNGKENDNEVKGEGNWQDYGMRMYDTRVGRFFSPDPLIVNEQQYPELSSYQFAGNTPIQAVDLDGLEPSAVLTKNSDGKYRFTEPAVKLMSWLSGTDEETVRNTNLKPRSRPFGAPWYSSKAGGGAMTSDKKIRYTRNFFKNWKHKESNSIAYFGGEDDYSVNVWLSLSGHETGHLRQRKEFKTNLGYYLSFVGEYLKGGSHDASGKEQDAEKGQTKYTDFVKFTNDKYGDNSLVNLFQNKEIKDDDKNKQLGEWMKAYDESKKPKEEAPKKED